LSLDRNPGGAFDRFGTFAKNGGASIWSRWRAGGQNGVAHAVDPDGLRGDFGQLSRSFSSYRLSLSQGFADRMDWHHHRRAHHIHGFVVRRTCAATPAGRAFPRVSEPQTMRNNRLFCDWL
jgi:hypothetical protein